MWWTPGLFRSLTCSFCPTTWRFFTCWRLSCPTTAHPLSTRALKVSFISVLLLKHAYPHDATQIPHSLTTWLQGLLWWHLLPEAWPASLCSWSSPLLTGKASTLCTSLRSSLRPLIPLRGKWALFCSTTLSGHAFFSLFCKTWDREIVSRSRRQCGMESNGEEEKKRKGQLPSLLYCYCCL